jgi:FG-GAP-like repeat
MRFAIRKVLPRFLPAARRRGASLVLVGLVVLGCCLTAATSVEAAPEGRACPAEPTVMSIAFGDLVTCAIEVLGDTDTFQFNGSAGDFITIMATGGSGAFLACVEMVDPLGNRTGDGCASYSGGRIDTRLVSTGLHTIFVRIGGNFLTSPYVLVLERVNPVSTASRITFGQGIDSEISPVGDMDAYFFDGIANDFITITATGGSGPFLACLELVDPQGIRRRDNCASYTGGRIDLRLARTGRYTILVTIGGNYLAWSYRLELTCSGRCRPLPPARIGDFDGDGRVDLPLYRPSTGMWHVMKPAAGSDLNLNWGVDTDLPMPGDYDGDGKTDVAVYRPATGVWWVLLSSTNWATFVTYQWGTNTDIPVPGDYDGDRKTDIAVYRPATGTWYAVLSATNSTTFTSYQWGQSTDIPVPGDYDGDGTTDVAVYRPSTGAWWVLLSTTNSSTYFVRQWGATGDIPVQADYDGDGRSDIGVYRPGTGVWYLLESSTNFTNYRTRQWGVNADSPVPGDYDGDGKVDVAIYRPATGTWHILLSSTNDTSYVSYQWGMSTDIPVIRRR